jgi:uncharacterized protein YdeI (YjbR/CyaY-like superfamily)
LYVKDRDEWRSWLEENHATGKEVWLIFFKKNTGKPSIPYEDAVEEAICFGWIDSIVRKIDAERYSQKFTPRTGRAGWSATNKVRAERMIEQERMTEAGLNTIREAKRNGSWDEIPASKKAWGMPVELKEALAASELASKNFKRMAPSYQKQCAGWIASAKRGETRIKRTREVIGLLERNQKLGMK